MKPVIVCGSRRQPIIMEVIGKDGQTVGEYVDKPDKKFKPPYILIEEAHL